MEHAVFTPLTTLAGIGLLAACAQWVAWRVRLPAILFLLVFGMLVGPVAGLLDPDALFGELLFPMVSLAVAIILFEGSLTLRFSELSGIGPVVRNLVTVGALITWLVTAAVVHFAVGFDYDLALLFGALVVVTGPTVIVPMLRTVRPNRRIADILRWEGIIIDPIGALLAVLAFDFYLASTKVDALGDVFLLFLTVVASGFGIGLLFGAGLSEVLKRHWLPDYLRSPVTLLMVVVAFALADALEHESGLLAVTVFGIVMANYRGVEVHDILDFKESLSVLLISGLFIILAARIDLEGLLSVGWPALMVVASIIFVARPAAVYLSGLGSDLTIREKALIAWIGPRGIVCAAVTAIFALRLEQQGSAEAGLMVPLAFLVIICTVVLQSLTAKPLARMLGVRDPAPSGYLILGGGRVGRMLAKALNGCGVRVVIADSDWDHISQARMDGIEVYFGNPVSDHADRYLDLSGVGHLVTLSGRANFDVLTAQHFRSVLGSGNLFELPTSAERLQREKHVIGNRLRGKRLFGESVTHNEVLGHLLNGWTVRQTRITDEFGFEAYLSRNGEDCLPLFAIQPGGRLRFFTDEASQDDGWMPENGWEVVSLMAPSDSTAK